MNHDVTHCTDYLSSVDLCSKCEKSYLNGYAAKRKRRRKMMADNHFADVGKKGTMSLTLALIVLDRLNTSERIDVARDNLAEAVRVVLTAAKYRIPQKPEKSKSYWASLNGKVCPTCKYLALHGEPKFCFHCGQALDWS